MLIGKRTIIVSESIAHVAEGLKHLLLSSDNRNRRSISMKAGSGMKFNRKRAVSHTAIFVWKN